MAARVSGEFERDSDPSLDGVADLVGGMLVEALASDGDKVPTVTLRT
jgi:hypothetical protein